MKIKDVVKEQKEKNTPLNDREKFLTKENAQLKGQIIRLQETSGFQQILTNKILKAVDALSPLQPFPYKAGKSAEAEMAAVLQLSDWHIGEQISARETGGFGLYNWNIAQERANYIATKFLNWLEAHRTSFKIPKVYIFGQADWVSGDIHKELLVTNEFPLPEQAVRSGQLLAQIIARIAPHAPELHVVAIEPDNHGRLQPKPQFKQKAANNMSFVTYAMAEALLKNHGNINWINNHRIRELVNVAGQNFLVEHGDVIKSWQGIPYMGMMRQAAKEASKHMRAILEQQRRELSRMHNEYGFDYVALAHFHVPNVIDNQILVNGSLSGTSEFDEGVGRYAKPSQVSFLVHPKYGFFDWTPWTVKK
jgi:DNA repair exonuclease SbcCD nuclease subunit